ncbi:hypothetical protein ACJJTC_004817 [Scirpophaga incertulas]
MLLLAQIMGKNAILITESSAPLLTSTLGEVILTNETLSSDLTFSNDSLPPIDFGATCGINFCSGSSAHENSNLAPPSQLKIQVIAGIYLACMVFAVFLVAFGVDSLTRYTGGRKTACTAFMAADFTQAFVGCAYGISNIGYVMICFGVLNALAAPVGGGIVKITGRFPVMVTALVLNLGLLSALMTWRPDPEQWLVFYGLAAVWGAADAVWLVQVNALSGILFPGDEEAAYSNFRLWEATGSVLSYASAPYLCVRTRVTILIGLLLVGFAGYSAIELMEYRAKRRHHQERSFELVTQQAEQE